jgi:hypothetical protein
LRLGRPEKQLQEVARIANNAERRGIVGADYLGAGVEMDQSLGRELELKTVRVAVTKLAADRHD